MNKIFYLFPFLLFSCGHPNHWKIDELIAGDRSYDSSRLKYFDPAAPKSPLEFEMLRVGQNVEVFLSMKKGQFASCGEEMPCAAVAFQIGEESFNEEIPLREGGMKLRLSLDTAKKLTEALQEGKNVSILIDGYEKTLEAGRFSRTFSQFLGKRFQDEHLFEGHIE